MIYVLFLLVSLTQAQEVSTGAVNLLDDVRISNLGKDTRDLLGGRYRQTGKPTFAGGFCFSDGTCQTTAATTTPVNVPAGSTFTINSIAPTGVSTPTVNGVYADGINAAYAVFVTSNSSAVIQYSVGVTSVTYSSEGKYIVTWQRPFLRAYYQRHITNETSASSTLIGCMVSPDAPINTTMTSILCLNQGAGVSNPNKVFIMATGAQ